jgi:hypothetical protein
MPDLTAIMSGISALQTASELAKGLVNLRDTALIQGKVIELQSVILSAQSSALSAQAEQAALLQQIDDLKKEMTRLEAWETEKEKYSLVQLTDGVFAYALKEETEGGEPPHKICASCYQHGSKQILQQETRFPGRVEFLLCHGCGSELIISGARHEEHKPPKPNGRRGKNPWTR